MRIRLERIQGDFFWGDLEDERKIHLVKWPAVCKAKDFGGLRLRRLDSLNQALLGKWLRRFFVERDSLWRKIICGKFKEMEGGWTTRGRRDSFRMSLWRDTRKALRKIQCQIFYPYRNGSRISFWWDI
ncbi:hypothetical protein CK203_053044 [Vitis vinifera]|uniref:Uncharacterized protein n=1 Tax=Vitis vinifera TaxID=29760 RepID=A0A438FL13_VITVI|nr:hypothetical protein CK203_053044 [Vitis vinifera]